MLIKTKKDIKIQAQKVSSELGVSLSTVINAFLRQFIRDKEVTLSVAPSKVSPYLKEVIREAEEEYKNRKNKRFLSGKELIAHLQNL